MGAVAVLQRHAAASDELVIGEGAEVELDAGCVGPTDHHILEGFIIVAKEAGEFKLRISRQKSLPFAVARGFALAAAFVLNENELSGADLGAIRLDEKLSGFGDAFRTIARNN